ncbi:MAG: hypothetical protein AB1486_23485 [Planctomycetota bacterium]
MTMALPAVTPCAVAGRGAARVPLALILAGLLAGCAATPEPSPRPLGVQVREAAERFLNELSQQGVAAQSYYTLFLPEGVVNLRHRQSFRAALERGLRQAEAGTSLRFNASADRVFFLSHSRPPGWETPGDLELPEEILARELHNGTPAGWTALHAYWAQVNRLLIGGDEWIQALPDSIRADLTHPLRYVLRVSAPLDSNPDVTTFVHGLTFELVEVGKERSVQASTYPLILTYPLP